MKHYFFSFMAILLLLTNFAKAQKRDAIERDSLLHLIHNSGLAQKDRIEPMARLCNLFINLGDTNQANVYLNFAIQEAKSQNDSKYMIEPLWSRIVMNKNQRPADLADIFEAATELAAAMNSSQNITKSEKARALLYLGNANYYINNSEKALQRYYEAIDISENISAKDKENLQILYSIYRNMYGILLQNKYDAAQIKQILDKCFNAATQTKDINNVCEINFLKSAYFLYVSPNWDSAYACIKTAEKGLADPQKIRLYNFCKVLQGKIDCLLKNTKVNYTKEILTTLERFDRELAVNNSPRFEEDKLLTHYLVNMELKNYGEAIKNLEDVITLFPYWAYYFELSKIYSIQGNYKKQAEVLTLTLEKYQKEVSEKAVTESEFNQARFEFRKLQNQIKMQKLQRRFILIGSVIVLGLTGVMIYFIIKSTRRKRRLVELKYKQLQKDNIIAGLREEAHQKNIDLLKQNREDNSSLLKKMLKQHEQDNKTYDEMQHINTEQAKVLQELAVETLSDRELMYCMLFYLRMNVKDISGKMNVSPQSVWVIKNRIKKKFNLTKEQSLDQFLNDAFAEK